MDTQITFANLLLYRKVYFVFFDFFSFTVFDLQCFILMYNICVCHLFNKEISNGTLQFLTLRYVTRGWKTGVCVTGFNIQFS